MTQKHHTPIARGAAANAATFNSVYSDLDAAVNSFGAATELTISGGVITVTGDNHTIDTEGDAASDNLATVNGMSEGQRVLIHAENAARTVVIQHGVGNITTNTGEDFELDDADKAVILTKVGTNINAIGAVSSSGGYFTAYAKLSDEKAQNTQGGTFTQGAWRTRDLTTEVDTGGIVALAANAFTLLAGSYYIRATAPAYRVNSHQTRIQNTTDAATELTGSSARCGSGDQCQTISIVEGEITLADTKVLELQHYCQTTFANQGFGYMCNFTTEVYSVVEIWKLA